MAFLTALLARITEMLQKEAIFDWPSIKLVSIAVIIAALSYLLKNLLSNSRNHLFTEEPV
ncbi:MAG: hypothetical protein EPN88_02460 [Bacteroidetes bacterium]|nr:MAG: hypothetical protein EPN88_02460 [Bacteroidota bacterium]